MATAKLVSQFDALAELNLSSISEGGATVIFDRSQELVPVKTGNLKNSGDVVEYEDGYAVEYTAEYAAHVEYGTSKMQAQPYLRPAIDESKDEILKVMAKALETKIKDAI